MPDISSTEPLLATSLAIRKNHRIAWAAKFVKGNLSSIDDPAVNNPGDLPNTTAPPHYRDNEDALGVPNTYSSADYVVQKLKKLEDKSLYGKVEIPMEELVRAQLVLAMGESYKRSLASRWSRKANLLDHLRQDLVDTVVRESQVEANLAPYSARRLSRWKKV